jgi:hypothetical protein
MKPAVLTYSEPWQHVHTHTFTHTLMHTQTYYLMLSDSGTESINLFLKLPQEAKSVCMYRNI